MNCYLQQTQSPFMVIKLDKIEIVIGRQTVVSLRRFRRISDRHVLLKKTDQGEWFAKNLSEFGTFVNNKRIGEKLHRLEIGDIIELGAFDLQKDDRFSCVLSTNYYALTIKKEVPDVFESADISSYSFKESEVSDVLENTCILRTEHAKRESVIMQNMCKKQRIACENMDFETHQPTTDVGVYLIQCNSSDFQWPCDITSLWDNSCKKIPVNCNLEYSSSSDELDANFDVKVFKKLQVIYSPVKNSKENITKSFSFVENKKWGDDDQLSPSLLSKINIKKDRHNYKIENVSVKLKSISTNTKFNELKDMKTCSFPYPNRNKISPSKSCGKFDQTNLTALANSQNKKDISVSDRDYYLDVKSLQISYANSSCLKSEPCDISYGTTICQSTDIKNLNGPQSKEIKQGSEQGLLDFNCLVSGKESSASWIENIAMQQNSSHLDFSDDIPSEEELISREVYPSKSALNKLNTSTALYFDDYDGSSEEEPMEKVMYPSNCSLELNSKNVEFTKTSSLKIVSKTSISEESSMSSQKNATNYETTDKISKKVSETKGPYKRRRFVPHGIMEKSVIQNSEVLDKGDGIHRLDLTSKNPDKFKKQIEFINTKMKQPLLVADYKRGKFYSHISSLFTDNKIRRLRNNKEY